MLQTRKEFYHSQAWQKISKLYLQSKFYICERCGGIAKICHHRNYISDDDVKKQYQSKLYGFENLEALCMECHNKEHFKRASDDSREVIFSSAGDVVGVKTPPVRSLGDEFFQDRREVSFSSEGVFYH